MTTVHERRRYSREWARRMRTARLAAVNQAARTCQRRQGAGVCGGRLEAQTDGHGHLTLTCLRCVRRWAGICLDCPAPVAGRIGTALRCVACKALAARASTRRYQAEHQTLLRRQARQYYQRDQAKRQHRNEYKRAWRKANRDKVRLQKRRAALRQLPRVVSYNQHYRARLRLVCLAAAPHSQRTCLTCSTAVTGRTKKCADCKARDLRQASQHPTLGQRTWRAA